MRATVAFASLASLATLAAAQSGYGRFPCTIVNPDGSFSPDQAACASSALVAPGSGTGNADGTQGDGVNPTNAQCVVESESGAYFCGIAGAQCSSDANCDNGHCVSGLCQGGFNQGCASSDQNCLGFLYCLAADYSTTATNECGAVGAFCQDYAAASPSLTDAAAEKIFNQFCATGYCNFETGNCDNRVALGGDCSSDPTYSCEAPYTCDSNTFTCVVATASQRARSRRSMHQQIRKSKRNVCPAGHEACRVAGLKKGYECVDVASNIEQCGACVEAGGVDCTALPNVAAVGCVAGTCEIWACEDGFDYDPVAGACIA